LKIYGRNAVAEALRGRRQVRRIWRTERVDLPIEISDEQITVDVLEPDVLEQLCGSPDHQGIVAEAEPYPYADAESLLEPADALLVALDQVQDPQNLGAICRTAETAGAAGVVLPERRSADITAAVCKASAGAVEHLPVARVRNLADFLLSARKLGAWVYGADAAAPDPYTTVDYGGRAVIVLGGEAAGLRPRVRDSCDLLVSIPMAGRTASLNVSAAAAVLLYEARRQREAARS
jgi:23S rRNA (guanosine2251-2'-O)-methyltransferase